MVEFLEVLLNDEPKEYHEEVRQGHRSIFCGSAYGTLDPGIYSYQISYRAEGDWIFQSSNAYGISDITGPFAGLPIDKVRARVQLPEGVLASQFSASLMGNTGEGSDYVSVDGGDKLVIETTQPLNRNHGIFMNVVWSAGDYATRRCCGSIHGFRFRFFPVRLCWASSCVAPGGGRVQSLLSESSGDSHRVLR